MLRLLLGILLLWFPSSGFIPTLKKGSRLLIQVQEETSPISFFEHKANDCMQNKINFLVGPQEPRLATVRRRKLAWFGHVPRHDSLSKTILRGTLEGGQRRGRQRKCWMDNIKEWTTLPMPKLLTRTSCRKDGKRKSAESSRMSPDETIGQGTELNWTELIALALNM